MTCTECGNQGAHKMDCSRRFTAMFQPITWTGQVSVQGSVQGSALVPTPEPARPKDVALVAGSVIGVRAWRINGGGQLWPLSVRTAPPWEPGENLATCYKERARPELVLCENPDCPICHRGPHQGFEADCVCGFYAVWQPMTVPVNHEAPWYVSGVVEAYGRVVLGPGGFRAAKARVLAMCGTHPSWRRERMPMPPLHPQWEQVPKFPSLREALVEYPTTDPMEYL